MFALSRRSLASALCDIAEGLASLHLWPMLGWLEIKQRYRRSVIGPFWLTISTAALLLGMGPLYARLFGQDISEYFAFLAIGFVVWMLLAGILNDSCQGFISAEGFIKQTRLPLTAHVLRVIWKNLIIFAHNAVIIVVVLAVYHPSLTWVLLLSLLGLAVITVNALWVGILLALLCARFRDIPPTVGSVVQIAFFLSPVLWRPEMLGDFQAWAQMNPIFHFLEIVRAPLLGQVPTVLSWAVVGGVTVAGYLVMLAFFARFRARIAYWV